MSPDITECGSVASRSLLDMTEGLLLLSSIFTDTAERLFLVSNSSLKGTGDPLLISRTFFAKGGEAMVSQRLVL